MSLAHRQLTIPKNMGGPQVESSRDKKRSTPCAFQLGGKQARVTAMCTLSWNASRIVLGYCVFTLPKTNMFVLKMAGPQKKNSCIPTIINHPFSGAKMFVWARVSVYWKLPLKVALWRLQLMLYDRSDHHLETPTPHHSKAFNLQATFFLPQFSGTRWAPY